MHIGNLPILTAIITMFFANLIACKPLHKDNNSGSVIKNDLTRSNISIDEALQHCRVSPDGTDNSDRMVDDENFDGRQDDRLDNRVDNRQNQMSRQEQLARRQQQRQRNRMESQRFWSQFLQGWQMGMARNQQMMGMPGMNPGMMAGNFGAPGMYGNPSSMYGNPSSMYGNPSSMYGNPSSMYASNMNSPYGYQQPGMNYSQQGQYFSLTNDSVTCDQLQTYVTASEQITEQKAEMSNSEDRFSCNERDLDRLDTEIENLTEAYAAAKFGRPTQTARTRYQRLYQQTSQRYSLRQLESTEDYCTLVRN